MKILLLISQERFSREAALFCQARVAEGARLDCVYILDQAFSSKIESILAESTFVADKPGEELGEALNREYRQRGYKILADVVSVCPDGSQCKTDVRTGDYFEVAASLCDELKPQLLVVTEPRRGFWHRFLGNTDEKKLRGRVTVPMKVF